MLSAFDSGRSLRQCATRRPKVDFLSRFGEPYAIAAWMKEHMHDLPKAAFLRLRTERACRIRRGTGMTRTQRAEGTDAHGEMGLGLERLERSSLVLKLACSNAQKDTAV
jgi:hypothetical protein